MNNVQTTMRDPSGNIEAYKAYFELAQHMEEWWATFEPTGPADQLMSVQFEHISRYQNDVRHQYSSGVALDIIAETVVQRVTKMAAIRAQLSTSEYYANVFPLEPRRLDTRRLPYGFLALALLTVAKSGLPDQLRELMTPIPAEREYFYDLMSTAFIPTISLMKKYKPYKDCNMFIEPVLRALALPESERAGALAAYMKKWENIVRPFGLKSHLNTAIGQDNLFPDFAFEVALAVCAYDIDDSSFSDHRYYPRDLVEHYRAHVRNTRDAWRAPGIGAGVPVEAPPPPPKADLSKSKRKGVARWLELVTDGDNDAVDDLLEDVGKPKKIKNVDGFLCVLAEKGQIIHADLKDDDTLAAQASSLAMSRDLGEFESAAGPPYGPTRCVATLLAFDGWLTTKGYRLAGMETGDDIWHAVLVRKEYHAELLSLGSALGIEALEAKDAFSI